MRWPGMLMMMLAICTAELPAQDSDEEFPDADFFVGGYTMIGKVLESDSTFMGLLLLEVDSSGARTFRRIIGVDTIRGTWGIEYAIGAEVRVVRIRWLREDRRFECTYQWCMDFDSYPRLSGHCYETGKATDSPGMEVGFAIWPEWSDPDTPPNGHE
jgi:hypothetical protein